MAERRIAQDLGLLRILSDIYGSAVADEIMGIVSFVLTDESAAFQHYPAFIRKHLSADRQVNLAVAVSQTDTTPLYYDLFPGSIIDLTECVQLIDQLHVFGYQNVGLLFDRGYFSEPNVRELDAHGFEFIMMLRDDQNFVKKLIKAHAFRIFTTS